MENTPKTSIHSYHFVLVLEFELVKLKTELKCFCKCFKHEMVSYMNARTRSHTYTRKLIFAEHVCVLVSPEKIERKFHFQKSERERDRKKDCRFNKKKTRNHYTVSAHRHTF